MIAACHQSNFARSASVVNERAEKPRIAPVLTSVRFGITPVTFRASTSRSTIRLDCAFKGGIRGWVIVSPKLGGLTWPMLTGSRKRWIAELHQRLSSPVTYSLETVSFQAARMATAH